MRALTSKSINVDNSIMGGCEDSLAILRKSDCSDLVPMCSKCCCKQPCFCTPDLEVFRITPHISHYPLPIWRDSVICAVRRENHSECTFCVPLRKARNKSSSFCI